MTSLVGRGKKRCIKWRCSKGATFPLQSLLYQISRETDEKNVCVDMVIWLERVHEKKTFGGD